MKRALVALATCGWIGAALAQGASPSSAPPPPRPASSSSESSSASSQPPQRGNIAPILDIRIQDAGISLPKPREDVTPEKPPAK